MWKITAVGGIPMFQALRFELRLGLIPKDENNEKSANEEMSII